MSFLAQRIHHDRKMRELHQRNPHNIIDAPKEWVQWSYHNNYGSLLDLMEYVECYKMLRDIKEELPAHSHAQYAAWEYLLKVRLIGDIT